MNSNILLFALIIILALLTFALGWLIKPAQIINLPYEVKVLEPYPVVEYVDRWHTQIVTEEKEVEVIKETIKEKIVYQYIPQSDWESVDELKAWLKEDEAPLIIKADASGNINFNGQCEDVAFQARDRAYQVGKWLDTEILSRAECIKYQKYLPGNAYSLGANDGHYLNKAVINNEVWYVQVDTDTIWLAYYLDPID